MKKYLLSALALPLLFACSSEDYLDQKATDNDQFAGIEKVDATFSLAESPSMRMDNGSWLPQNGDLWGFAWMGDGTVIANNPANGRAYQNHNLIQTDGIFKPQTSIYVGKYYLYRPYDKTTVSPQAINFKSLEEQPLAEGYESDKQPWKDLAKTSINIADKWTNVTKNGHTDTEGTWDNAGTEGHYKLYPATFSNQTGLDLAYVKNNVEFDGTKKIKGATDIEFTPTAGTKVGAADIYGGTVELAGAAKSFTYAPTVEPNDGVYPQTVGGKVVYHNGDFWADKKNLAGVSAGIPGDGFTFTDDAITLKAADEKGVSTEGKTTGWFWFNSLPVTNGTGGLNTNVTTVLNTSYGDVTISKTVKECAYALEKYNASATAKEWIKLSDAASATAPKAWNFDGTQESFINHYGNHKGKYALTVDFSQGQMNGMHIKNDAHLQKALKYYIASGKTESSVILKLDKDANGNFEISKISIALLQTINATSFKVGVRACDDATHTPAKIIVTQDGQTALDLANAKEVPALNNVFAFVTDVYLSSECDWTWAGGTDGKTALNITNNGGSCTVKSITNEGTLTVKATNVQLSEAKPLANAAGATMNITKVTTVKNALTNLGTINVGAADNKKAELRAYDAEIRNDATSLTASGTINNYGVVGVSAGTTGTFNNYGLIDMKDGQAITLLTTNEKSAASAPFGPFSKEFAAGSNMMGTVKLPNSNPLAIVSVSNATNTGFIKYEWTAATYTHDTRNVKYNTLVVSNDITFTGADATEINFVEFNGTRTQVVNPASNKLPNLKGIIVNEGKSIILEKDNRIDCKDGVSLRDAAATIYNGGDLFVNGSAISATTNYFTPAYNWSLNQIVKY